MKRVYIKGLAALFIFCMILCFPFMGMKAKAADLDEILNYTITVEVNPDATLHINYHVEWKVLDSLTEGPLTWVKIGIPNMHCTHLKALSENIRSIAFYEDRGYFAKITLDRAYLAGEVVTFDFELTQDYMYQMNELTDGETVYHFTPGWFDDINVDRITVKWDMSKAIQWKPSCEMEDGYLVWTDSLKKGQKMKVSVTYPNDAYEFNILKSNKEFRFTENFRKVLEVVALWAPAVLILAIVVIVCVYNNNSYERSSGFNVTSIPKPKITRTRIVYYPSCPNCGAARPEGKDNCAYCGSSFIKSEDVIKEEDIPEVEWGLKAKNTNGLYRYNSEADTYLRVLVTPVDIPTTRLRSSRSRGSGGGFSSHSSSSHRSSCAHSSCACACACACAGGGRAGCTTKDFYHTNLKLEQIRKRVIKQKS